MTYARLPGELYRIDQDYLVKTLTQVNFEFFGLPISLIELIVRRSKSQLGTSMRMFVGPLELSLRYVGVDCAQNGILPVHK